MVEVRVHKMSAFRIRKERGGEWGGGGGGEVEGGGGMRGGQEIESKPQLRPTLDPIKFTHSFLRVIPTNKGVQCLLLICR